MGNTDGCLLTKTTQTTQTTQKTTQITQTTQTTERKRRAIDTFVQYVSLWVQAMHHTGIVQMVQVLQGLLLHPVVVVV